VIRDPKTVEGYNIKLFIEKYNKSNTTDAPDPRAVLDSLIELIVEKVCSTH
jgi:hypothetical protein